MTDDEYLKARCRDLKASIRYFSSKNRHRREKHVVREFLRNLGKRVLVRDLESVLDDPPDVRFQDCLFEIKEHMDPRERHREYKDALEQLCRTKDPEVLLEPFTPKDITLSAVYRLVLADATALATNKYPLAVIRNLDLLVYINLEDVMGMRPDGLPDVAPLASLGWRSVSFLKGHWSCVLAATEKAPTILRDFLGKPLHRKPSRQRPHLTSRSTRTRASKLARAG
jgi:hypothetical protein